VGTERAVGSWGEEAGDMDWATPRLQQETSAQGTKTR
jgi:hypothetical protein